MDIVDRLGHAEAMLTTASWSGDDQWRADCKEGSRWCSEARTEILRLRQALEAETEECARLRKALAAAEERLGEIQSAHYDQPI